VDRTIRFLTSGTPKRPPGMPHHLRVRSHRFYRGAGAVPELPDPLRLTSRHQLLDGRRRGTLSFDDIGAAGDIPVGFPISYPSSMPTPWRPSTPTSPGAPMRSACGVGCPPLPTSSTPATTATHVRAKPCASPRGTSDGRPGRLRPGPPRRSVLARRAELDLVARLAEQRWDLVLAPNFSMYTNQPRAEHLLNFRRNLLIAAELAAAGVPAVPNIYWFRKEDLDRYLAWVADVGLPALAVNLQTFRTEEDWATMAMPGSRTCQWACPSTPRSCSREVPAQTAWPTSAGCSVGGGGTSPKNLSKPPATAGGSPSRARSPLTPGPKTSSLATCALPLAS